MTTMNWSTEAQNFLESVWHLLRRAKTRFTDVFNRPTAVRREKQREQLSEEAQHCEDLLELRSRLRNRLHERIKEKTK